MDSLLKDVAKFVNGHVDEVCSKVLLISSMDSLLKEVAKFVNGYMGEVC